MTDFHTGRDTQFSQDDRTSWIDVQKRVFTKWCNMYLAVKEMKIEDLQTEFSDGLTLIHLLEVISSKQIAKYNKRPRVRAQKMENLNFALNFLKREGIRLVNIAAEDIIDCNLKLILGMIWTIILRYQINVGTSDSATGGDLLEWVNSKIADPSYEIHNFTTDWADARAIVALVNAVMPGLVKDDELTGSPVADSQIAIDKAENVLHVPAILTGDDMVEGDKLANMTYISLIRAADIKIAKEKEEAGSIPTQFAISGPLVDDPNNVVVFHKTGLEVTSLNDNGDVVPSNGLDVKVEVKAPSGVVLPHVTNHGDGHVNVEFEPKVHGPHTIDILVNGEPIAPTITVDVNLPVTENPAHPDERQVASIACDLLKLEADKVRKNPSDDGQIGDAKQFVADFGKLVDKIEAGVDLLLPAKKAQAAPAIKALKGNVDNLLANPKASADKIIANLDALKDALAKVPSDGQELSPIEKIVNDSDENSKNFDSNKDLGKAAIYLAQAESEALHEKTKDIPEIASKLDNTLKDNLKKIEDGVKSIKPRLLPKSMDKLEHLNHAVKEDLPEDMLKAVDESLKEILDLFDEDDTVPKKDAVKSVAQALSQIIDKDSTPKDVSSAVKAIGDQIEETAKLCHADVRSDLDAPLKGLDQLLGLYGENPTAAAPSTGKLNDFKPVFDKPDIFKNPSMNDRLESLGAVSPPALADALGKLADPLSQAKQDPSKLKDTLESLMDFFEDGVKTFQPKNYVNGRLALDRLKEAAEELPKNPEHALPAAKRALDLLCGIVNDDNGSDKRIATRDLIYHLDKLLDDLANAEDKELLASDIKEDVTASSPIFNEAAHQLPVHLQPNALLLGSKIAEVTDKLASSPVELGPVLRDMLKEYEDAVNFDEDTKIDGAKVGIFGAKDELLDLQGDHDNTKNGVNVLVKLIDDEISQAEQKVEQACKDQKVALLENAPNFENPEALKEVSGALDGLLNTLSGITDDRANPNTLTPSEYISAVIDATKPLAELPSKRDNEQGQVANDIKDLASRLKNVVPALDERLQDKANELIDEIADLANKLEGSGDNPVESKAIDKKLNELLDLFDKSEYVRPRENGIRLIDALNPLLNSLNENASDAPHVAAVVSDLLDTLADAIADCDLTTQDQGSAILDKIRNLLDSLADNPEVAQQIASLLEDLKALLNNQRDEASPVDVARVYTNLLKLELDQIAKATDDKEKDKAVKGFLKDFDNVVPKLDRGVEAVSPFLQAKGNETLDSVKDKVSQLKQSDDKLDTLTPEMEKAFDDLLALFDEEEFQNPRDDLGVQPIVDKAQEKSENFNNLKDIGSVACCALLVDVDNINHSNRDIGELSEDFKDLRDRIRDGVSDLNPQNINKGLDLLQTLDDSAKANPESEDVKNSVRALNDLLALFEDDYFATPSDIAVAAAGAVKDKLANNNSPKNAVALGDKLKDAIIPLNKDVKGEIAGPLGDLNQALTDKDLDSARDKLAAIQAGLDKLTPLDSSEGSEDEKKDPKSFKPLAIKKGIDKLVELLGDEGTSPADLKNAINALEDLLKDGIDDLQAINKPEAKLLLDRIDELKDALEANPGTALPHLKKFVDRLCDLLDEDDQKDAKDAGVGIIKRNKDLLDDLKNGTKDPTFVKNDVDAFLAPLSNAVDNLDPVKVPKAKLVLEKIKDANNDLDSKPDELTPELEALFDELLKLFDDGTPNDVKTTLKVARDNDKPAKLPGNVEDLVELLEDIQDDCVPITQQNILPVIDDLKDYLEAARNDASVPFNSAKAIDALKNLNDHDHDLPSTKAGKQLLDVIGQLSNLDKETPSAILLDNLKDIENALNAVQPKNLTLARDAYDQLEDALKLGNNPIPHANRVLDALIKDDETSPQTKGLGIIKGLKDLLHNLNDDEVPLFAKVGNDLLDTLDSALDSCAPEVAEKGRDLLKKLHDKLNDFPSNPQNKDEIDDLLDQLADLLSGLESAKAQDLGKAITCLLRSEAHKADKEPNAANIGKLKDDTAYFMPALKQGVQNLAPERSSKGENVANQIESTVAGLEDSLTPDLLKAFDDLLALFNDDQAQAPERNLGGVGNALDKAEKASADYKSPADLGKVSACYLRAKTGSENPDPESVIADYHKLRDKVAQGIDALQPLLIPQGLDLLEKIADHTKTPENINIDELNNLFDDLIALFEQDVFTTPNEIVSGLAEIVGTKLSGKQLDVPVRAFADKLDKYLPNLVEYLEDNIRPLLNALDLPSVKKAAKLLEEAQYTFRDPKLEDLATISPLDLAKAIIDVVSNPTLSPEILGHINNGIDGLEPKRVPIGRLLLDRIEAVPKYKENVPVAVGLLDRLEKLSDEDNKQKKKIAAVNVLEKAKDLLDKDKEEVPVILENLLGTIKRGIDSLVPLDIPQGNLLLENILSKLGDLENQPVTDDLQKLIDLLNKEETMPKDVARLGLYLGDKAAGAKASPDDVVLFSDIVDSAEDGKSDVHDLLSTPNPNLALLLEALNSELPKTEAELANNPDNLNLQLVKDALEEILPHSQVLTDGATPSQSMNPIKDKLRKGVTSCKPELQPEGFEILNHLLDLIEGVQTPQNPDGGSDPEKILATIGKLADFFNKDTTDIPNDREKALDLIKGTKNLLEALEDDDNNVDNAVLAKALQSVIDDLKDAVEAISNPEERAAAQALLDELQDALDKLANGDDSAKADIENLLNDLSQLFKEDSPDNIDKATNALDALVSNLEYMDRASDQPGVPAAVVDDVSDVLDKLSDGLKGLSPIDRVNAEVAVSDLKKALDNAAKDPSDTNLQKVAEAIDKAREILGNRTPYPDGYDPEDPADVAKALVDALEALYEKLAETDDPEDARRLADAINAVEDDLRDCLKRMHPDSAKAVKDALDTLKDAADELRKDPKAGKDKARAGLDKVKNLIEKDSEPKVVKDKNAKNPKGKVKTILVPANEDARQFVAEHGLDPEETVLEIGAKKNTDDIIKKLNKLMNLPVNQTTLLMDPDDHTVQYNKGDKVKLKSLKMSNEDPESYEFHYSYLTLPSIKITVKGSSPSGKWLPLISFSSSKQSMADKIESKYEDVLKTLEILQQQKEELEAEMNRTKNI